MPHLPAAQRARRAATWNRSSGRASTTAASGHAWAAIADSARRTRVEALVVDRSQGGGPLGASILFGALVRDRLAELEAVGTKPGRGSARALEAARSDPSCPACAVVAKAEASARLRSDRSHRRPNVGSGRRGGAALPARPAGAVAGRRSAASGCLAGGCDCAAGPGCGAPGTPGRVRGTQRLQPDPRDDRLRAPGRRRGGGVPGRQRRLTRGVHG